MKPLKKSSVCSKSTVSTVEHTADYWMQLQAAQSADELSDSEIDDIKGFHKAAGRVYIYPTNYPVRDYQFNIVRDALYRNTLVMLPTGLGNITNFTFIIFYFLLSK